MNRIEAEKVLKKAVKTMDLPTGRLYLQLIDEDKNNYYYDVCVIPDNARIDWKTNQQIVDKYAISPPWYVNKKSGDAGINWGMPEN